MPVAVAYHLDPVATESHVERRRGRRQTLAALLAIVIAGLPACSVRRLAVNALGDAMAQGTSSWASDDDPELIRQATPFALKTIESLLVESPHNRNLLLAAASGFTQYSYAFVQCEADYVEASDLQRAISLRAEARTLYRRARDYGLRGLEVDVPGFGDMVRKDAAGAAARAGKRDVPLLYWTAASWGALISLSKDNGAVTVDLPAVEAMMRRALALDEGFDEGAIHDFFIAYEGGRPAAAGGSAERARKHLERALVLSHGHRAAPLVSFAETVSVANQDRKEFEALLKQALAIDVNADPDQRLANLIEQRRARWLLSRADDLFIE
jgi:predicted anti-sigma-YlaC factor YlaD